MFTFLTWGKRGRKKCSAGSKLHLNHPLVIIHTPKPGAQYAMRVKEGCGSRLALTVVTNCTIILCWNSPNINLVVPVTAYHIAVKYSAVFTLSRV